MAAKSSKKNQVLDDEEIVYEEEKGTPTPAGEGGTPFWKNTKFLTYGAGALVLIGGFLFWRHNQKEKSNAEGMEAMIMATAYFEADSLNRAIAGDGAHEGFEGLAEAHGGTDAGNIANFYLGLAQLRQGNMEAGEEAMHNFKPSNDLASASGIATQAFIHEQKGEFKEAAGLYEQAARTPKENPSTTPLYLMDAGRNFEAAGDREAAHKVYSEIREKFPTSSEAMQVERYIGRTETGDGEE